MKKNYQVRPSKRSRQTAKSGGIQKTKKNTHTHVVFFSSFPYNGEKVAPHNGEKVEGNNPMQAIHNRLEAAALQQKAFIEFIAVLTVQALLTLSEFQHQIFHHGHFSA